MCGIAGIVDFDGGPVSEDQVRAMCAVMRHRGPDGEGVYFAPGVGLGMRRLSVIDLDTGDQPVRNEDGTAWVVFNGEIYNYRELRRDLEGRGHRFHSSSDTESIIHLYEDRGQACVKALRGMFGLAIWDQSRRTLLLARDRLGIKPLYYTEVGGRLAFASELKALLQLPEVEARIDWRAFGALLGTLCTPADQSIVAGIKKLEPGHVLVARPGRGVRVERYWDVWFDPVMGRPEADVADELRGVARALGTDHHERILAPDATEILEDVAFHLDEPFGDSSAIPTYMVSKLASAHVKVVLSGDGGDELFAGYERYLREERERRHGAPARWAMGRIGRLMPRGMRGRERMLHLSLPDDRRYLHGLTLYEPHDTKMLLRPDVYAEVARHDPWAREAARLSRDGHWLSRLQDLDLTSYLPLDILTKVDRMSMAHSIEARVPLLDHKVVEFAARIPPEMLLRDGRSKHILRRAMAGLRHGGRRAAPPESEAARSSRPAGLDAPLLRDVVPDVSRPATQADRIQPATAAA